MTTAHVQPATALDLDALRAQFPILSRQVHGKPLVYLDNAATSQKPAAVIEALDGYYRRYNANVHRGLHQLSGEATDAYEAARKKVARFLNAPEPGECVFTRGATEAINLVAASFGRWPSGSPARLRPGDRVLITQMEHHSNIVPWQMLSEATGATLDYVPITDTGELDLEAFADRLSRGPRIVSLVWISNSLGTINPIEKLVAAARAAGAVTLVDACQAAPHTPIDVQRIGCDFLAISGHKMFGPTGIGVLYGKMEHLGEMPPYQGGGEMIERVTLEKTTYARPPQRFEAGTPHIAGAIGLGAAIDWMATLDWDAVRAHEADLLHYGTQRLSEIEGLRLIGTAADKASILSFTLEGMHPYDVGPVLDRQGVAVRTGHHCCQPVMDRFGIPATIRASLALYNTRSEIDALVEGLHKARRFFS